MKTHAPIHPGEVLREDFLIPLGLSEYRVAEGRFAAAVAEEGGLPSLLWAGELKKNETRRMRWEIEHEDFHIEMECGMIPATPGDPSLFKTDPDIKLETLRHGGKAGRVMAKRKGPAVELRGNDGKMLALPLPVHATESMLSEVRDGAHYPAVTSSSKEASPRMSVSTKAPIAMGSSMVKSGSVNASKARTVPASSSTWRACPAAR